MIETVDPGTLLTPRRLDFAIKWRFFRHLMAGGDPDAERVYRWHIERRTRGLEPRSWKVTVNDYVRAAADLLEHVRRRGFDPARPVRLGNNGLLIDGAHRVSLGLAVPCFIHVRREAEPGHSAPWDEAWLKSDGIAPADLARVLQDAERLNEEARNRPHPRS